MPGKTKFFLLLSAILLTMCRNYANEPITYENGLSCRNYVEYRFFEGDGSESRVYTTQEGADCTYVCRDESEHQTNVSGSASELYTASVDELEAQFCEFVVAPTFTPTLADSPTPPIESSPTNPPTQAPSATATIVFTADPLLAGTVSMCDLGAKLINFRIIEPAPELTGRTLEVQIAGQETACYVNPANNSLLTCAVPNEISFPARVVVTLDGALVNDFIYSGLGCIVLTTPTPA